MRVLATIFGALGLLMLPASAAEYPTPNAAYSAQRVMEGGGFQMSGQLYHDHGKERWESSMGGTSQVRIMRPDLGKLIMLMPQMNMAMEMPIDTKFGPPTHFDGPTPVVVGSETMGGEATTKYRTEVDDKDGAFTVFTWVTDDGIVMRMEGEGPQGAFALYLEGMTRGPQDAALFEVPAGTQLMPANPAILNQFK